MRGGSLRVGLAAGLFNRGRLSLSRTTVADNLGHGIGGGLVNQGGTVTMAGTKFVHNLGFFDGGGALNDSGTLITDTSPATRRRGRAPWETGAAR